VSNLISYNPSAILGYILNFFGAQTSPEGKYKSLIEDGVENHGLRGPEIIFCASGQNPLVIKTFESHCRHKTPENH
jgi:hypothetical protein